MRSPTMSDMGGSGRRNFDGEVARLPTYLSVEVRVVLPLKLVGLSRPGESGDSVVCELSRRLSPVVV